MASPITRLALVAVALLGAGAGAIYVKAVPGPANAFPILQLKPALRPTESDWLARVSTVAGDGVAGALDGPAAQARFADPFGVAVDGAGNVYLAEGGDNNRIRKVSAKGIVSTLAGAREGFADGVGVAAAFNTPSGIALDAAGNLYVADTGNNAIRKVAPDGTVTTLAGGGDAGFRDGKGRAAQFNGPLGVALGPDGALYVADAYNDRIRRVAPDGQVSTVAGAGQPGERDGAALDAQFDTPCALALDAAGQIYIADVQNHAIRKLGKDGQVTTLARATPGDRDGLPRRPMGLALTHDGFLYMSSGAGGRVLQLAPDGQLRPLNDAEHPASMGKGDGTVRLGQPRGMALARDGSLYVADAATMQLRRLEPAGPGPVAPELPELAAPAPRAPALRPAGVMPWPLKPQGRAHEVVGVMGEVRGNVDGERRDHLHGGLDIRAGVGAPVLAIAAGKVSDPLPNWADGEPGEGFSIEAISYAHMRVGRDSREAALDARFQLLGGADGKPQRVRIRRGTRFQVGDTLGSVNRMAHVQLDYRQDGDAINPLSLPFAGLRDTVAPRIKGIALLDAAGLPLTARRGARLRLPRALQEVHIVVDAYDQMDGNQARRRLGLYKLGYQLLRADGSPVPGFEQPVVTQVYERLPASRDAVKLAYAPGSGVAAHGGVRTRFLYDLNNTLSDGQVSPGAWRIGALAPGNYVLRILAADYAGNVALAGRDLRLCIE